MTATTPLALAVLALAASLASATPIPADAVAVAKDMNHCWKVNPFSTGALPQDDNRSAWWNNACIDQKDPCSLLKSEDERAKVKDGYCQTCSTKPPVCPSGQSCEGDSVCKSAPTASRVTLPAPSEGEGDIRQVPLKAAAAPPAAKACTNTPGCITRYVAGAWRDGIAVKEQMNMAWAASRQDRDHNDFSKCDELTLRNTEHYLYHYWSRLDSQVYNQFPLTFCGISYGYSFVKWTGVKQYIMDDPGKDSPPSMEEAYWGCRGLWDAYEPEQKVAFGLCN